MQALFIYPEGTTAGQIVDDLQLPLAQSFDLPLFDNSTMDGYALRVVDSGPGNCQ